MFELSESGSGEQFTPNYGCKDVTCLHNLLTNVWNISAKEYYVVPTK